MKDPTRGLSFDESDIREMVKSFSPVPLGIDFTPSVLDKKLGTVERVYSDDGEKIYADLLVPLWVANCVPEPKFACSISRNDNKIVGVSMVASPLLPAPEANSPTIVTSKNEND